MNEDRVMTLFLRFLLIFAAVMCLAVPAMFAMKFGWREGLFALVTLPAACLAGAWRGAALAAKEQQS